MSKLAAQVLIVAAAIASASVLILSGHEVAGGWLIALAFLVIA